jgi:ectoine hydroxylase-related dioxygenase (phytanoyl-CoA dioxygenase family)
MNIVPKYAEQYQDFQENGYTILKKILPNNKIKDLRALIQNALVNCASSIGCQTPDYLSAVSRWAHPSPVTTVIPKDILKILLSAATSIMGTKLLLKKLNIICKNKYCSGSVPYHQDITYSPYDPYKFSAWLALDDVSASQGALEVIPRSHLNPLTSAVDFWSPTYQAQDSFKQKAVKVLLKAGDLVLFDARLWHGSNENQDLSDRYALVTRWSYDGWKFSQIIPPIIPQFFGMWTSGQQTEEILRNGLKAIFNETENNFLSLIVKWENYLQNQPLPFHCNVTEIINSLKKIKILHLAYLNHNGGDATGTIYKNLWHVFLSPLSVYLDEHHKPPQTFQMTKQ